MNFFESENGFKFQYSSIYPIKSANNFFLDLFLLFLSKQHRYVFSLYAFSKLTEIHTSFHIHIFTKYYSRMAIVQSKFLSVIMHCVYYSYAILRPISNRILVHIIRIQIVLLVFDRMEFDSLIIMHVSFLCEISRQN